MKKLILLLGLILLTLLPAEKLAVETPQSYLYAAANHERTVRGIHGLHYNANLASIAQSHAQAEAACMCIFHDMATIYKILAMPGVRMVGENVGEGPTAAAIHAAFMASPEHKANILNRAFTDMGVGAVLQSGTLYVVEDFTQMTSVPRPSPRPQPTVRPRRTPSPQHSRRPPVVRPRPHLTPRPAPSVKPSPTAPAPTLSPTRHERPFETVVPASPWTPPPLIVRPHITKKVSWWIVVAVPLAFILGLWACARGLYWLGWRRR